ncbi:uncharacterized protein LOC110680219 [Aedes aegypti]|uniref:Uncharacterized protein n=1 Tax=Aedes aegypti TaxID=7159 RepID=A0A903VHX3_AEDAE|nr:uncharacterized protein LOC110680219 [Aedes aegypti]
MIEDISDKIEEIGKLDTNIHSLMYKSVEVHNDILSLEATTNRLLADTKKLSDDLDDVRYLDELITILNGDIGPVIHREWPYQILFDTPDRGRHSGYVKRETDYHESVKFCMC